MKRNEGSARYEFGAGKGSVHAGRAAQRRGWGKTKPVPSPLFAEPLEPRVMLSVASPYQTAVDTFIGSAGTTVIAGPGGYGGTPLLDLNHDGLGDMIVRYSIFNNAQPEPQVGAVFSNADGSARLYNIANYPTGTLIKQIVVADVNKDGQPDVVVLREDAAADFFVDVFVGHPDGTFTSTTPTNVSDKSNSNLPTLYVFDMTGDGKPDIVLQVENVVTVLKGNGDGTFATPIINTFSAFTAAGISNITFQSDLSGDGIADVVISGLAKTSSIETLAVYKGLATGSYSTTPSFMDNTNSLTLLSVQKLATNGNYDIVASGGSTAPGAPQAFFIFSGNGDGTFNATPTYNSGVFTDGLYNQLSALRSPPQQPLPITDLNNDGKPDMVVMEGPDPNSNIVLHILKNTTATNSDSATFSDIQDITVPNFASTDSLTVEDVDGDGTPDLVVQQLVGGNDELTIFFGNGDGTFDATGVTVADTSIIVQPTLADINGDHKLDVVFEQGETVVHAYLNTTGRAFQSTPEETDLVNSQDDVGGNLLDVNGDNEADLLTYLVSAGTPPFSVVEVGAVEANISNGDGTFTPTSPYAVLALGTDAAEPPIVCDINGDGKPDLVFDDGRGLYEVINGATPPPDPAGSTEQTALDLGTLNGETSTIGFLQPPQPGMSNTPEIQNFYKITVPTAETLRVTVTPEAVAETELTVLDTKGGAHSGGGGSAGMPLVVEINAAAAGTYFIEVQTGAGAATNYGLDIESPSGGPAVGVYQGFTALSSEQSAVAFGHVLVNTTDTEQDFTVRNDGDSTLTFDPTNTTLPAGFTFGQALSATLAPKASATFSIVMTDSAPGTFSGNASIASNDPNGPFVIPLSGSVTGATQTQSPSISVNGPNGAITSGQATAVDFSSVAQGATDPTVTFTVNNTGNAPLTLTTPPTLPNDGAFLVGSDALAASIPAGQSDTFTIKLDTSTVGNFTGNLIIVTNDPNTPSFTIPLSGQVTSSSGGGGGNESKTLTPGSATDKFTYMDSNDLAVTITFTGKNGSVTVDRSAPTNLPGDATDITFTTTDPKAGITITTKGSANGGVTTVGSITGSSSLASFTATTTDLTGQGIVLTGDDTTIDKLSVRDLDNGADIILPGAGPVSGIAVTLADAGAGSDLTSGSGISSLTFNDWAAGSTVTAPWVGKLTGTANKLRVGLDGSFDANLTLAGTAAPKGVTLGTAKIAGGLGSETWAVTGAIGTITGGAAGSVETPWILADATNVTGLTLGDVINGDVTFAAAGNIKTIKAIEWLAGNITGGSIGTLTIAGDKKNNIAGDLGADVTLSDGAAAKTLTTLSVAGSLSDATITSAGVVNSVTLGAMNGSQLLIGTMNGVTGLAADSTAFVMPGPAKPNLVSLTIKGLVANQPSFTASVIDAWNIGKASLKSIDAAAEANPFGFAADKIASLSFTTAGVNSGKPVTLKNLDTTESLADELADHKRNPNGITLPIGSFTLRLV